MQCWWKWWGRRQARAVVRRARTAWRRPGVEELEQRDLPSALTLLPDDVLLTRNYLPPGSDEVDSGFLIFRPATHETIPLVVPRLNDPTKINYGIYILQYQFQWQLDDGVQEPHILFVGSVVPDPAHPGTALGGLFDFDIAAGTLTSIYSESSFGGSPGHDDLAIGPDGTVAVTRSSFRDFNFAFQFSVATPAASEVWFEQTIFDSGSISFRNHAPTTSMAFDTAGVLYAAFAEDDGFHPDNTSIVTGNTPHPPGIYRLDPQTGIRTPIFTSPQGQVHFQFAADGSIIALVGDDWGLKYYKKDVTQERVVRIDPVTHAVQTLFVGAKRFDYQDLLLDSSNNIILSATDNSRDGNTNIFKLVQNTKKKKPKITASLLVQDDPSGSASYGVVTAGPFAVVPPPSPATAQSAASPGDVQSTNKSRQRKQHHHRGRSSPALAE